MYNLHPHMHSPLHISTLTCTALSTSPPSHAQPSPHLHPHMHSPLHISTLTCTALSTSPPSHAQPSPHLHPHSPLHISTLTCTALSTSPPSHAQPSPHLHRHMHSHLTTSPTHFLPSVALALAFPKRGHSLSVFTWPHLPHLRHFTFRTSIPNGLSRMSMPLACL